ncbi:uncharacterized protein KQ657_005122 [Scheffersomyces spartinae]|uniref:TPR-like protein n=1 Tax=Scheffersomyces spartinae TaxID=45513 RepID=A0A9P7V9X9_9ASCO|nr:uncharacterized protein KQ657_005122 [Scheffersomyces spartinae]KAG7193923.1 hypothetical protein KQ657_005122 [Scheffersomyces spartinae]
MSLEKTLARLLLLVPYSSGDEDHASVKDAVRLILEGRSRELVADQHIQSVLFGTPEIKAIASSGALFVDVLRRYTNHLVRVMQPELFHMVQVALLQLFIQGNFTGPSLQESTGSDLGGGIFGGTVGQEMIHSESLKLLSIEGQQPYDLMVDPLLLVVSLLMSESFLGLSPEYSLVGKDMNILVEQTIARVSSLDTSSTALRASVTWFWVRALQVHLVVVTEPPSVLTSVSSQLLTPALVNAIATNEPELQRNLQLIYFLEKARIHIHGLTEHLATSFLIEAKRISELQLVLSGAKAKRTKFQKFHTSALIILAKSKESSLYQTGAGNGDENPENFELNSDLLLERPQFESLDDLEISDERNPKRVKFSDVSSFRTDEVEEPLLPIAIKTDDIPSGLRQLDPNDQPPLNDLDNVQLLLRLTTIKQTTPASDPLIAEELMALVSRVLSVSGSKVNWTIFSRALWERSVLETGKAKTIERGILQMTSLVEEIGIKIKSRIIPQAVESPSSHSPEASRLRFIHQLTLFPQWAMDAKLADKYMSLGVLRSAIEIYERLNMSCEAALCYAAVGQESEAENVILKRIETHPQDARAISILGDIRQDPAMWTKAWEIGRYPKAKSALSRYYYNPPKDSQLVKSIPDAIKHMNDCLKINPLNYENWFFYGCLGLESGQFELSAEAFTRCVGLDDDNAHALSNLATSFIQLGQMKQAYNALKKAVSISQDKPSWKILENFLIVSVRLNEWNDVLMASRELINVKVKANRSESSVDIPVIEQLVEILVTSEYPTGEEQQRLSHFQASCIDFVCNMLPTVINSSGRLWRLISRVELWRKKPWAALECYEKAYRALSQTTSLETEETTWNEAVEACGDLVAAYESLGELEGKHGAGDIVCKDWKYKARTSVRSLMSKGKDTWEDSPGWERLQELKEEIANM